MRNQRGEVQHETRILTVGRQQARAQMDGTDQGGVTESAELLLQARTDHETNHWRQHQSGGVLTNHRRQHQSGGALTSRPTDG